MRRKLFATAASALAVLALAAASLPALATGPNWFYNSEGCDGYGRTWLSDAGTNEISSETDAELVGTSTDCYYSYSTGNYQSTGGTWYYGIGQGWVSGGYMVNRVVNSQHANYVGHSGCSTNTPSCPGVSYAWTSY